MEIIKKLFKKESKSVKNHKQFNYKNYNYFKHLELSHQLSCLRERYNERQYK